MIQENELRLGTLVKYGENIVQIKSIHTESVLKNEVTVNVELNEKIRNLCVYIYEIEPISLTEEWLVKLGFSVINESSAGKRYGYVTDGIFSSDLNFTFWKTTKEAGKFFRGDLEFKSVHQIQNLYFALTGDELTVA